MGEPDVDAMLERMPATALLDWKAFEQVHGPIGIRRLEWYMAQLACILVNLHRGRHDKARKVEDFILFDRPKQKRVEFTGAMEMLEFLKAWSGWTPGEGAKTE